MATFRRMPSWRRITLQSPFPQPRKGLMYPACVMCLDGASFAPKSDAKLLLFLLPADCFLRSVYLFRRESDGLKSRRGLNSWAN